MSDLNHDSATSIARNCGQCLGHILAAIRTPLEGASTSSAEVRTIRARVLETTDGGVTCRRIVIDQIIQQTTQPHSPLATTS